MTVETMRGKLAAGPAMWLGFAEYAGEEGDTVRLSFPSALAKTSFESSCLSLAADTASEIAGRRISFDISVSEKTEEKSAEKTETPSPEPQPQPRRGALNPIYTFDNFVKSEPTAFAYTAAMSIAMNPGVTYNPCLFYGGVGLGKTHLLQSIGNYIQKEDPRKNVIYVTSETFTNDYIQSMTDKNQSSFRMRYRNADILLVDDIHFLEKKLSTQEELFHTFNELYESGRQIVFTCDRPVSELKDFTDRLKSRFTRGLNINLLAPDYETRVAILKKKCENRGARIGDAILNYMAENIKTNVRDLEGALTTLLAYSNLINSEITLEIAEEQLKNIISAPIASEQDISISSIVREVAAFFNVETNDIRGKKRTGVVSSARNVAIYLTRKITQYSTTEIGNWFDRNHSTVTYAIDKVDKERKENAELSSNLEKIEAQVRAKAK